MKNQRLQEKSIYCVNFGGYQKETFGELHEVNFYVGSNKREIVQRARKDLCVGTLQQHCDDNLVVFLVFLWFFGYNKLVTFGVINQ